MWRRCLGHRSLDRAVQYPLDFVIGMALRLVPRQSLMRARGADTTFLHWLFRATRPVGRPPIYGARALALRHWLGVKPVHSRKARVKCAGSA